MGRKANPGTTKSARAQKSAPRLRVAKRTGLPAIAPGGPPACYVNRYWQEDGMAGAYVLRRLPDGSCAMASFLIDFFCLGLKEAVVHPMMSPREFQSQVLRQLNKQMEIERITPDQLLALVAAAIHHARRNGFRLPLGYERAVALLGDIGDASSADVCAFGIDGVLYYAGTRQDLESRLAPETLEAFLDRDDVDVEFMEPDEIALLSGVNDRPDESVDFFAKSQQAMLDAIRRWCFANGEAPSLRLAEAVDLLMQSMLSNPDMDPDHPLKSGSTRPIARGLGQLLSLDTASNRAEIDAALGQFRRWALQFKDPREFFAAIGMEFMDEAGDSRKRSKL